MLHFVTSYMKQNKSRKQTLESAQNGLEISFNPLTPKSDFIDFTLSNAIRFYLSKGDPLGVKGLKP